MRFVIYGAGWIGSFTKPYLEKAGYNIAAFMDSDPEKQGKKCCGLPIITIEEYKENYIDSYIIIAVAKPNNISQMLEKNEIFHYVRTKDLPPEYGGLGDIDFKASYYPFLKSVHQKYIIYGINAFSLMLYKLLKEKKDVLLLPEKECNEKKVEWVNKYCPDIKLCTCEDLSMDIPIIIAHYDYFERVELTQEYFVIDGLMMSSNNKQYINKEIKALKNTHSGNERCFIVATGPSLKTSDLEILDLNHEFCISMNGIVNLTEIKWRPDVYICVDGKVICDLAEKIKQYDCRLKLLSYKMNGTSWLHSISSPSCFDILKFSDEISLKLYFQYTVTSSAIQMAIYMGFKKIYLIGVDCNYSQSSSNNHFYESDKPEFVLYDVEGIINGLKAEYERILYYSKSKNVEIYNATRGGKLEVFPRVDFDSLF